MNLQELRTLFTLTQEFSFEVVLVQALVLLGLSGVLSLAYIRFANSLSNRTRLALILPFMALTTMLIITVIKSSLALSLGLVGALSIVRFRAAIKDPEELAYIFLAIALGLGFGADQVSVTVLFFIILLTLIGFLYLYRYFVRGPYDQNDSVHLDLRFSKKHEVEEVVAVLKKHCQAIKLTRMQTHKSTSMMFLIQPTSLAHLDTLTQNLHQLDSGVEVSILQYQPLV